VLQLARPPLQLWSGPMHRRPLLLHAALGAGVQASVGRGKGKGGRRKKRGEGRRGRGEGGEAPSCRTLDCSRMAVSRPNRVRFGLGLMWRVALDVYKAASYSDVRFRLFPDPYNPLHLALCACLPTGLGVPRWRVACVGMLAQLQPPCHPLSRLPLVSRVPQIQGARALGEACRDGRRIHEVDPSSMHRISGCSAMPHC
jgi:hypothetical protein